MGSEQRNALLAVVLSGAILFGWQFWFAQKQPANAPIEPAFSEKVETEAKRSTTEAPVAGPIEPATKETFHVAKGDLSIDFDNTLTVKDFQNPQTAFRFENTVGSKQPLRVEFD